MKIGNHVDKCLSYIDCDLKPPARRWLPPTGCPPAVTISRQTGCGATAVAGALAEELVARDRAGPHHWTIYDRNLVERVLEEHKLPPEVAKFMPEDRVSAIQDAVEELLGLHPSARTLQEKTSETIQHLAALGHAILIGRGANVITGKLPNVFHVRLVAPVALRVEWIMARNQLDAKAAREIVRKGDLARKRYLRDRFHVDIDDSLLYDLVINTAHLPHQTVACLIGDAVMHWAAAQEGAQVDRPR